MIKLIGIIFILICMSSIFVNYINNDEELAYKVNNLFFFLEYEIEDVGQAARGGATVDFNNDSRIDFAVSFADEPFNQSIISIFYNNIKKFVRRDIFQFNYTYINDINTGDFDNDGDIDIIYTYNEWKIIDEVKIYMNGTVNLLKKNGNMSIMDSTMIIRHCSKQFDGQNKRINPKISSADFDGDGDLDFLLGDNSGQVELFINNGNGEFSSEGIIHDWGEASWGLTSADFIGDSNIDFIIVAEESMRKGNIWLIENIISMKNSSNYFKSNRGFLIDNFTSSPGTGSITFIDYEKDGDMDFVFGEDETLWLYIQENNSFLKFYIFDFNKNNNIDDFSQGFLTTADFNNDGYCDLLVGGAEGKIRILINNVKNLVMK